MTLLSWVFYAFSVGAVCAAGGWLAARFFRLLGWPVRWAWAASLVLSVLIPALRPAWDALVAGSAFAASLPGVAEVPGLATATGLVHAAGERMGGGPSTGFLESGLAGLWLVLTIVLVWRRVDARREIARRRERWKTTRVAGARAFLSEETGPGVVGFLRPALVFPRWVLGLRPRDRRLVLLHELEHRRAGDTRLSQIAHALFVLLPWNLPLWWQFRRLRLAVELDCDQRVLARTRDPRAYGEMLLDSGGRLAIAGVSPFRPYGRSALERRIRSLVRRRPSHPVLRMSAALGGLLLLTGTALSMPMPGGTTDAPRPMEIEEPVEAVDYDEPPRPLDRAGLTEAEARVRRRASRFGSEVEAMVLLFHVSSAGRVDRVIPRVPAETPELTRPLASALREATFRPATRKGEPVGVWQAYRLDLAPETER